MDKPKPKAGQFWHVVYEGRFTIVEIATDGEHFWALGQGALWHISGVAEWIREIPIAHVEQMEDAIDGYCLTCGSCGIPGCCAPTKCAVFTCAHSNVYFEDYKCLQDQWGLMHDFIQGLNTPESQKCLEEVFKLFKV
jgi:hypothetical protein